jgi:hypothetical protein
MTVPQPLPSLDEQERYCMAQLGRHDPHTNEHQSCKAILASLKRLRERDADAHAERTKIIEKIGAVNDTINNGVKYDEKRNMYWLVMTEKQLEAARTEGALLSTKIRVI